MFAFCSCLSVPSPLPDAPSTGRPRPRREGQQETMKNPAFNPLHREHRRLYDDRSRFRRAFACPVPPDASRPDHADPDEGEAGHGRWRNATPATGHAPDRRRVRPHRARGTPRGASIQAFNPRHRENMGGTGTPRSANRRRARRHLWQVEADPGRRTTLRSAETSCLPADTIFQTMAPPRKDIVAKDFTRASRYV